MPRPYPAELRARAVEMVRSGEPVSRVAAGLGISEAGLHNWVRQDRVDRAECPGVPSRESDELRRASKRIRELELEVEILRAAAGLFREDPPCPKASTR